MASELFLAMSRVETSPPLVEEEGLLQSNSAPSTMQPDVRAKRLGDFAARRRLAVAAASALLAGSALATCGVVACRKGSIGAVVLLDEGKKVDYNVRLCEAGTIQSGCYEGDSADIDCCALPGNGSCIMEMTTIKGKPCAPGGAVATCCAKPQLAPPDDKSMFCWIVAESTGGEPWLVRDHHKNKQSIFACDAASVYSDGPVDPVPVINIGSFKSSKGFWNSYVNADVFLRAWDAVLSEGKWAIHGWTVKADADTVWFPDRLVTRLAGLNCRNPLNVRNTGNMLLGPIEVFSAGAVMLFGEEKREKCKLIWASGEDGFINECMHHLGIQQKYEGSLLLTTRDVNECNGGMIAFHPFKDTGSWTGCLWHAIR
eukprot:CAMPEP_0170300438 /NCGR_PEP_ID=MMETSP0116_2-20130129/50451_1 /TAXON_ID=400756 /ORGANISM="Durinskia baltica, Strain CSIRO CS-38" /LENGTH=370 /DNA_ID=CAMNT_0010552205 /DNA_START=12 /DNA_END=1124 /DNA_ORIENTATION=-